MLELKVQESDQPLQNDWNHQRLVQHQMRSVQHKLNEISPSAEKNIESEDGSKIISRPTFIFVGAIFGVINRLNFGL